MDLRDRRTLGFALMGGGILAALVGAWLAWSGICQWRLAANLQQAQREAFENNAIGARHAASEALAWQLDDAAVVLSVDPLDPASDEELRRAASGLYGSGRQEVLATRAFGQALRGETVDDIGSLRSPDAPLIRQLSELHHLQADRLPPLPDMDDGPSRAVLQRLLEERIRLAWRLGDGPSLLADSGRLLSIEPRHPARRHIELLHAWFSPHNDRALLQGAVTKLPGNDLRARWLRKLVELAASDPALYGVPVDGYQAFHEERLDLVALMIHQNLRTAEEQNRVARQQGADRDRYREAIHQAQAKQTPATVARAVRLAYETGDYQTIRRDLLPLVPPEKREQVRLAIAQKEWDIAALKEAGADAQAHLPRIRYLDFEEGRLRFHLVSDVGVLPPKSVVLRVDDEIVPPERVQRRGSAFVVELPEADRRIELEIEMDGTPVHRGEVRR